MAGSLPRFIAAGRAGPGLTEVVTFRAYELLRLPPEAVLEYG